jgi:NADH dehydrogenase (ubiquinone) Fe-S protein 3
MNLIEKSKTKKIDCLFAQFITKIIPSVELQKSDVLSIICKPDRISKIMLVLKNSTNFQFKCLTDMAGIDFIRNDSRLAVSYNLLSVRFNQRIRVVTFIHELEVLPSLTKIFMCSDWLEREIWDLYGIFFEFHSDLRRLLNDYSFEGYPMRKDFPLSGYVELRYDQSKKRIVLEPIELTQEFRSFTYDMPW